MLAHTLAGEGTVMSTYNYGVELINVAVTAIRLSITPGGASTWTAESRIQLGTVGGPISISAEGLILGSPLDAQSLVVTNFATTTKAGDTGTGQKNYPDGTFPSGPFTWRCLIGP